MDSPTQRNRFVESEARPEIFASGRRAASRFYFPASENGERVCYEHRSHLVKHGIMGYRLDWASGELPLAQSLLLKRWLQAPEEVAKAMEGGTWKEDATALRLIGG
jgi:hypothetical protein